MKMQSILLGLAGLCLLPTAYSQPGETLIARTYCNEAVELERERQQAGLDTKTDLSTFCFDIPNSEIQDMDWQCIIATIKQGESLSAAQKACSNP